VKETERENLSFCNFHCRIKIASFFGFFWLSFWQ